MTLEEYFVAETPELISFLKKELGEIDFAELCSRAILDGTLVIPKCDNEIDVSARRIEAAISAKALELIHANNSC